MIRRAALLVLFLQFALGSFGQVSGVQPRPLSGTEAAVPQVLEAGAKATFEKDTIRVTLPLTAVLGPEAAGTGNETVLHAQFSIQKIAR